MIVSDLIELLKSMPPDKHVKICAGYTFLLQGVTCSDDDDYVELY